MDCFLFPGFIFLLQFHFFFLFPLNTKISAFICTWDMPAFTLNNLSCFFYLIQNIENFNNRNWTLYWNGENYIYCTFLFIHFFFIKESKPTIVTHLVTSLISRYLCLYKWILYSKEMLWLINTISMWLSFTSLYKIKKKIVIKPPSCFLILNFDWSGGLLFFFIAAGQTVVQATRQVTDFLYILPCLIILIIF